MISDVYNMDCLEYMRNIPDNFFDTVEIEGNAAAAVSKIQNFFGAKFDGSEYDEELNYTYCGIELE